MITIEQIKESFEKNPEWQLLDLLKTFFNEQQENILKKENLDEIRTVFDLAETEISKQKDPILSYEFLIELCQKSLKDIIDIKQVKRIYKNAIEAGVHALTAFMELENLTEEDYLYCLKKCEEFDTGNRSARFYAEYGRILTHIKRKNLILIKLKKLYNA